MDARTSVGGGVYTFLTALFVEWYSFLVPCENSVLFQRRTPFRIILIIKANKMHCFSTLFR